MVRIINYKPELMTPRAVDHEHTRDLPENKQKIQGVDYLIW